MGTSFVDIHGRGFWMRDQILELWLRLLALHLRDPAPDSNQASDILRIRDQWLLASRGHFNGCVPHELETAVATPETRTAVVTAIESLMGSLTGAPSRLNGGTLGLMGLDPSASFDIESKALIEVGKAFLDLIAGRIGGPPSDTSFMPGSPRSA